MQLNQEELFEALGLLIQKIEACGASPALTDAVILASDISASVGNKWNPPQAQRAEMVRAKFPVKRFVRVWTNEAAGRVDKLTDSMALKLLQEQYGEEAGTRAFINLATGKAGCASAGRSSTESFMIEFRGTTVG